MLTFRAGLIALVLLPLLLAGCAGTSSSGGMTTPPPALLSPKDILGNHPPPSDVRPGLYFHGGKVPYIVFVLKKGNPGTPDMITTPKGPASYELDWRQDGERSPSGELITPGMGGTMTLRLHTPKGVPVLVRHWLHPTSAKYAQEAEFGGTPYRTKRDVYEDVWVAGGEQTLTWQTGP